MRLLTGQDFAREVDRGKLAVEIYSGPPFRACAEVSLHRCTHRVDDLRDSTAEQRKQCVRIGGNDKCIPQSAVFDELASLPHRRLLHKPEYLVGALLITTARKDVPKLRIRALRLEAE